MAETNEPIVKPTKQILIDLNGHCENIDPMIMKAQLRIHQLLSNDDAAQIDSKILQGDKFLEILTRISSKPEREVFKTLQWICIKQSWVDLLQIIQSKLKHIERFDLITDKDGRLPEKKDSPPDPVHPVQSPIQSIHKPNQPLPIGQLSAKDENEIFYENMHFKEPKQWTQGLLSDLTIVSSDSPKALIDNRGDEVYETFLQRGTRLALIINNKMFDCTGKDFHLPYRKGSDIDCENMKNFLTFAGYQVNVLEDLTAQKMKRQVKSFGGRLDAEIYDAAVVVILSHGEKGDLIYGSDATLVPILELTESLNGDNCPDFKGRPKIFIFQACRGTGKDTGDHRMNKLFNSFKTDGASAEVTTDGKVAKDADMLVAYATTPGYVSWRNELRGSWYIQAMCETFRTNLPKNI